MFCFFCLITTVLRSLLVTGQALSTDDIPAGTILTTVIEKILDDVEKELEQESSLVRPQVKQRSETEDNNDSGIKNNENNDNEEGSFDDWGSTTDEGADGDGERTSEETQGSSAPTVPQVEAGEVKTLKRRKKKRSGPGRRGVKRVVVETEQLVRVMKDMVEFPVRSTPLAAFKNGRLYKGTEWERSIIREDRFVDPDDIDSLKIVPWEQLVEWAGGEDKLIEVQEKQAVENTEKDCFLFECVYCEVKYGKIEKLERHVVGHRRSQKDRYRYVECIQRCVQEGIAHPSQCPSGKMPDKFPWGRIVCTNRRLYKPVINRETGNTEIGFDVPIKIQREFDAKMVDKRSTKRPGRRPSVVAPSHSS